MIYNTKIINFAYHLTKQNENFTVKIIKKMFYKFDLFYWIVPELLREGVPQETEKAPQAFEGNNQGADVIIDDLYKNNKNATKNLVIIK